MNSGNIYANQLDNNAKYLENLLETTILKGDSYNKGLDFENDIKH
jgi:hypothetical protein